MQRDASALAEAVGQALHGLLGEPAAVRRLTRFAIRHLPVDDAAFAADVSPPLVALRVAEALGLDARLSLRLAVAAALYFSAADLFDDCADGDVHLTPALDLNDACRLLFAHQATVAGLGELSAAVRADLSALFARQGLAMARGQALDLEGTDAVEAAAPLDIARGKTGAEFAAICAAPALAAGRDPRPWAAFGEAFGALGQILSDYLDLFLHDGRDWVEGKPVLPLRGALADPAVRALLAGRRDLPRRRAAGQWHLARCGAGEALAQAAAGLDAEMRAAARAAADPGVLDALRAQLAEAVAGVVEALQVFRDDPAPPPDDLEADARAAREVVRGFLERRLDAPTTRQLADALAARAALADTPLHSGRAGKRLVALAERAGWLEYDADPATVARCLRLVPRPKGLLAAAATTLAPRLADLDPATQAEAAPGLGLVPEALDADAPPDPGTDALCVLALRAAGRPADRPIARLRRAARLSGRFGDLRTTALAACALPPGADRDAARRWLSDAWLLDADAAAAEGLAAAAWTWRALAP